MCSVRGIQTCQHRARSRWGVCTASVYRHADVADGTAAGIGVRQVHANAGYRGAHDRQTNGPGICAPSVFRHAGIRNRRADGAAARIGIRHVPAHASQHGAIDERTDRRRIPFPSRSAVHGADGAAAGVWIRQVSAGADRQGAGEGQTDRSVLAAGVFRHARIRSRPANGTAAGIGIWHVPVQARYRGARD